MDDNDMAICRIDYMSWSNMQKIHDLVDCVRRFASRNRDSDTENYIREVVGRMEDVFEIRIGTHEYVNIMLLLRNLVKFVRSHRTEENDHEVLGVTGNIIKLVQGDTRMDHNQLTAMTFHRVKEAIEKVARNTGQNFGDQNIVNVAEEYSAKILADVFGGEVPANSQFVDKYYEMDPVTEDLLDNGSLVVDGMKVLIEDPQFRAEITNIMKPEQISKARMTNRWATVEQSKVRDRILSFVAVYGDGIKRKVVHPVDLAWLAKKDSIPRIDTIMTTEGVFLYEKPTAKMVAFLKERMKYMGENFDPKFHKIQTGIDGDVIPLAEYLINEGVIAEDGAQYTVWNEEGAEVFVGTPRSILGWAAELSDAGGSKYVGFSVTRVGDVTGHTLEKFVEDHG